MYTAWTAKGATRTTSAKPERPYKAEYANIKEQSGKKETTSLIWMHTAETGHSFYFENAKAIDYGRFKSNA